MGGGQEILEGPIVEVVTGAEAAVELEKAAEKRELLAVGVGTGGGGERGDEGGFVDRRGGFWRRGEGERDGSFEGLDGFSGELIEEGGAGGVEVFAFVADRAGAIAGPPLAGGMRERAFVDFAAPNGGEDGRGEGINDLFEGADVSPRIVIAALGAVGHRELIQPAREIDPELGWWGR